MLFSSDVIPTMRFSMPQLSGMRGPMLELQQCPLPSIAISLLRTATKSIGCNYQLRFDFPDSKSTDLFNYGNDNLSWKEWNCQSHFTGIVWILRWVLTLLRYYYEYAQLVGLRECGKWPTKYNNDGNHNTIGTIISTNIRIYSRYIIHSSKERRKR